MANAEQFGRLPLPLVEQGASFHPRALPLPLSGPCPPQITIIAAIGGPTAAVPSVAAAATVVVACSRYNESCHLAGRGRSHLSILPAAAPTMHCSAFESEASAAAAKGPPACVRDDNALEARRHRDGKEERKKRVTARRAERENNSNEGTKRSAAARQ